MNVKSILSEQFKDMISEETLNTIEETFQQAVDEKAKQKIELEVENTKTKLNEEFSAKLNEELENVDKDHTAKLQKLVEAIDTDHAVKLQQLVKKIDTKHTGMLKQVVEKYTKTIKNDAKEFQDRLVEEISNYLDLYLEKTVPAQQIAEAVENTKAVNTLKQIRQLVGINEEFVDSEVKEALIDGKKTIDSLKNELNTVIKENVDLKHKANKAEAYVVLEKKTADMPSAKKAFINKLLGNKAPEYIEENFSYVVEMFDKESQEQVSNAQEEIKKEFVSAPKVDRPQVIEEQKEFTNNEIERESSSEGVSGYLNEMKKISRFAR